MTPKTTYNAHKVAYLVYVYPEKKMTEIINLFQLPPIDINAAIWAAVDLGLISQPTKEGEVKFLKKPDSWDFGADTEHLIDAVYYCFEKLAQREEDLEENYVSNWLMGYTSQDTLIAIKRLLENKQLAEYEIEDGDSAYTFYTLYENRKKLWGKKQFKKNPLAVNRKRKAE